MFVILELIYINQASFQLCVSRFLMKYDNVNIDDNDDNINIKNFNEWLLSALF